MNAAFFSPAFGPLGVSASSELGKTWNPQAVGTSQCLSLPFRSADSGATGAWL